MLRSTSDSGDSSDSFHSENIDSISRHVMALLEKTRKKLEEHSHRQVILDNVNICLNGLSSGTALLYPIFEGDIIPYITIGFTISTSLVSAFYKYYVHNRADDVKFLKKHIHDLEHLQGKLLYAMNVRTGDEEERENRMEEIETLYNRILMVSSSESV